MGANEFMGHSDLDIEKTHSASLLKILIKVELLSIFIQIFSRNYMINGIVTRIVGASTHNFENRGC